MAIIPLVPRPWRVYSTIGVRLPKPFSVAATLVAPEDEIMLITSGGVLIRTRVNEIREMSRSTQGVTLINLSEGEKLSGLQCILDRDDDNGENGNGNGNGHSGEPDGGGHTPAA